MYYSKITKTVEQEIFELRYTAYLDNDSISPNSQHVFTDEYDETGYCYSYLKKIDGVAAGCIRACVYDPNKQDEKIPAMENYSSEIRKNFKKTDILLEANKYAIHPAFQNRHRSLKFALYGAVLQLANQVGADYIIGAIKPHNERFYTRANFVPISETKQSLRNNFLTTLMACTKDDANKYAEAHPRHFMQ